MSVPSSSSYAQNIMHSAKSLKRGSLLLTLKLPPELCQHGAHFKLVQQQWVKMGWGRAMVFVLQRL